MLRYVAGLAFSKDGTRVALIRKNRPLWQAELKALIANMDEPRPLLHPNMAEIYRSRVAALHGALLKDDTKPAAAETIRALVNQVTLVPENGELAIVLRGDLAAMLSYAGNKKPGAVSGAGSDALAMKASLVAGKRNHLYQTSVALDCAELLPDLLGRTAISLLRPVGLGAGVLPIPEKY